jgi:putative phosphoesterase
VLVGLVSDSHGLADPALPGLLAGCELVLHAGDAVQAAVLEALRAVAPVKAVRGNNDLAPVVGDLPETRLVTLGEVTALLVHDVGSPGRPHPSVGRAIRRLRPALVVHGHSHRPGTAFVDGVLFVNPGSAGPRRFSLPRTAGLLRVEGRRVEVALYDLAGPRPAPLGAPLAMALP